MDLWAKLYSLFIILQCKVFLIDVKCMFMSFVCRSREIYVHGGMVSHVQSSTNSGLGCFKKTQNMFYLTSIQFYIWHKLTFTFFRDFLGRSEFAPTIWLQCKDTAFLEKIVTLWFSYCLNKFSYSYCYMKLTKIRCVKWYSLLLGPFWSDYQYWACSYHCFLLQIHV